MLFFSPFHMKEIDGFLFCVYGAIWQLLLLALTVNQILQIVLLTGKKVNFLGQNCKSDEVLGHSYFP